MSYMVYYNPTGTKQTSDMVTAVLSNGATVDKAALFTLNNKSAVLTIPAGETLTITFSNPIISKSIQANTTISSSYASSIVFKAGSTTPSIVTGKQFGRAHV